LILEQILVSTKRTNVNNNCMEFLKKQIIILLKSNKNLYLTINFIAKT